MLICHISHRLFRLSWLDLYFLHTKSPRMCPFEIPLELTSSEQNVVLHFQFKKELRLSRTSVVTTIFFVMQIFSYRINVKTLTFNDNPCIVPCFFCQCVKCAQTSFPMTVFRQFNHQDYGHFLLLCKSQIKNDVHSFKWITHMR